MEQKGRKIIVAVTGASGSIYAQRLLERLVAFSDCLEELALIFSENGEKVWEYELGPIPDYSRPVVRYGCNDMFAPVASGSAQYDTMIAIPCSMGTLGRIASGVSDDLIGRAADVMLKERRRLILAIREQPLNLVHIENMRTLTLAGAIVAPASPSFYSKPKTVEQLVDTVVNRILDLAGIPHQYERWGD